MNERLYKSTKRLGLTIGHVAEVGVYHPETSNILGYIRDGIRADLFEPDPESISRIYDAFGKYVHVRVHPFAIYKENTKLRLYRAGASTFAADLPSSPALANDSYQPSADDAFEAEARRFDEFDDGTIDLLSIDTEGCEWYVLMHLKSRPLVISAEMGWKKYQNPFLKEIEGWMRSNGYRIWYKDKSDTVYIHNRVQIGFGRNWLDRLGW
jgi:FkbM family methyltransferase